jgi:hypothetical protein
MESNFPTPTSSVHVPQALTARYLFCNTQRGYFKSIHANRYGISLSNYEIAIGDGTGNQIGLIIDNINQVIPEIGTIFELVTTSAGALHTRVQYLDDDGESPEIIASIALAWRAFNTDYGEHERQTFSKFGIRVPEASIVEFYYVLWIGWDNGVAHRKGLGRILKQLGIMNQEMTLIWF